MTFTKSRSNCGASNFPANNNNSIELCMSSIRLFAAARALVPRRGRALLRRKIPSPPPPKTSRRFWLLSQSPRGYRANCFLEDPLKEGGYDEADMVNATRLKGLFFVSNEIWANIPICSQTILPAFTYENPRKGRCPFGPK
jgi:hypothetical protein